MFFFKRRKKEKTLENKFDELNEGILNEKDRENPHKVEHYVIERLEQMIETTKEIEDEKAEYKVVTSYLNDIQTLEGLTEEEKKPITDIASNIVALNKTRYELMHSEKKLQMCSLHRCSRRRVIFQMRSNAFSPTRLIWRLSGVT